MKKRGLILGLVLALALLVATPAALAAQEGAGQPQGRIGGVRGEVTAVGENSLTIQTRRGVVQVTTDEETAFRIPGVEEPSLEDISVGDPVLVAGRRTGDTIRARLVIVRDGAGMGRVGGQVLSVEEGDITISGPDGEPVLVHTDENTRFRIPGIEEPGLDDIHAGDLVLAAGERNEDGSIQARLVAVPREAERNFRLTGEVISVSDDTLVVRTDRGREVSLNTDGETRFYIPGVGDGSLADLVAGSRVGVGARLREGTLYTHTVLVLPEQMARLTGQVSGISGTTLTVETDHGPVQIRTDGGSMVRIAGMEEATLADVQTGDRLVCGGVWEDESTFQAVVVTVPMGSLVVGRPAALRGRAITVEGDRFTLGTEQGVVTVLVDGETVIRGEEGTEAALSDIHPGDGAGVRGVWVDKNVLRAEGIALGGEGGGTIQPKPPAVAPAKSP